METIVVVSGPRADSVSRINMYNIWWRAWHLTLPCIPLLTSVFLPVSLRWQVRRESKFRWEVRLDDQYPYLIICEHSWVFKSLPTLSLKPLVCLLRQNLCALPFQTVLSSITWLVIDYGNVSLGLFFFLIYPNNLPNSSVACNLSSFLKLIFFGLFCLVFFFNFITSKNPR